jgi:Fe-S cluster biogenesis protein NfuA
MKKNILEKRVDPVTHGGKRNSRAKLLDLSNGVESVLKKVRPYIKMHGGDVQLEAINGKTVILKISGACVGCALADLTYNNTVGGLIKKEIPQIKKVVIIN